jgi:hypothetical protein
MEEKTFKYKLDFYYQQSLIYLLTLFLYAGIRGSFIENEFSFVFRDPIVYIILLFVVISFVVLFLNIWRNRKLTLYADRFVFHSRTHRREFAVADIEWMHVGKERFVQTAGRFQHVSIKFKSRSLPIHIRVGRYERDRELVAEMERIAQKVPGRKAKRFLSGQKRVATFSSLEE